MELSTQGLVTDGVGKLSLSLSLDSPVAPSQEPLPLSSSLPAAHFFQCLSLILLAPLYFLAPSFVSVVERVKSDALHAPSLIKQG